MPIRQGNFISILMSEALTFSGSGCFCLRMRSLYYKQKQYLKAFEIKQEQRAIEQQLGFELLLVRGGLPIVLRVYINWIGALGEALKEALKESKNIDVPAPN